MRPVHKIIFLILVLLVVVFSILDLLLGSVSIPLNESFKILTGQAADEGLTFIMIQMRLPRLVTTLMTGAGLAVAGLMMQTLFRNPLAGPYVLGISSGAGLGVAIYVMSFDLIGLTGLYRWYGFGQAFSAIAGASLVFVLVLLVAPKIKDSVSLLIVGIMFGSLAGAIVNILQYFSKPELVQKFVIWTMGSLSSTGWNQIMVMTTFLIPGFMICIFLIKPMNALLLGELNAEATGVRIVPVRFFILTATSLIAGALTAFNGPVAFIGLIVPHMSRMVFNTTNHRILIPASMLTGMILLLMCDIISQVPGKSIMLPINAITAMIGAPVIIWIILGKRKLKTAF
jgi:iron complex transport system permease protein